MRIFLVQLFHKAIGVNSMKNWYRITPYISLGIVAVLVFILSNIVTDAEIKNILIGVFSNSIFFFLAYMFYDLIKQIIFNKEREYLINYIKNMISNDIFVALYFLKKVVHGYNLDSNTPENIVNIVNYSRKEVLNLVKNQSYLGFQIMKNIDEVRSLFSDVINDNFVLKYSTHMDSINILRIANNLAHLEIILRDKSNFHKSAESGVEFKIVNGKDINPENDEKYLLLKMTAHADRFVVYDSGYFEQNDISNLLSRYTFKKESAQRVSQLLTETFGLMNHWLPDVVRLKKNENRFRILKDFFSLNVNLRTKETKVYVADIVEIKR